MAVKYTTQEEFEDQMLGAQSDVERDYGLGTEAAPAPQASEAQGGQSQAAPTQNATQPLRVYRSMSGNDGAFGGTFAPLKRDLSSISNKIGSQESSFRQGAGERRNFEGIGGSTTLDRAFNPAASAGEIDQARGLVGAKYKGPSGYDDEAVENLREAISGVQGAALGGRSVAGASYFAGQENPSLSSGERRFEGARKVKDEGYLSGLRDVSRQASETQRGLEKGIGEAQEFAKARQEDEASIAQAARQIAEQRQAQAFSTIDERVAARDAEEAALVDAYNQFIDSGALDDLIALPGQGGEQLNEAQVVRDQLAAGGVWDEIMAKYSDLEQYDVPLLERQVSTHGKAVLGFPKEWYDANLQNIPAPLMATLKDQAMKRQAELENAGFSNEQRATIGGKGVLKTDPGRFSAFRSVYDGDGVETQDFRPYFGFREGTGASRENTATQGERFAVNRANDILGRLESLADPDTPYQAATVIEEGDRYLADLERSIKARQGELGESRDKALDDIKKARKSYKKAKKAKNFKVAARVIGGVGSLGLSEITIGGKRPAEEIGGAGMLGVGNLLGAKQDGV